MFWLPTVFDPSTETSHLVKKFGIHMRPDGLSHMQAKTACGLELHQPIEWGKPEMESARECVDCETFFETYLDDALFVPLREGVEEAMSRLTTTPESDKQEK